LDFVKVFLAFLGVVPDKAEVLAVEGKGLGVVRIYLTEESPIVLCLLS